MKKTLIGIFLAALAITGQGQGLNKIIVEKYYVSDENDYVKSGNTLPVGSVTWRIYVDMAPGYVFQQATGDKYHDLVFSTTTSFYNSDLGDFSPNGLNTTTARMATAMLDSWISCGAASKSYWGVLKSVDDSTNTLVNSDGALQNNDPSAGIPLTFQDGMILGGANGIPSVPSTSTLGIPDETLAVFGDGTADGNSFTVSDGAWYILGGVSGLDTTNRVLIAQVTTDGTFHYELNIQLGKDLGNDQSLTEKYAATNPQDDEMSGEQYNLSGTLTPDIGSMSCHITSPTNSGNYTAGSTIPVTATATCVECSIVKVEFFIDGTSIGVDSTSPYTSSYVGALGTHELFATASSDNDNQVNSDTITINLLATGLNPLVSNPAYSLYPVPANDAVTLNIVTPKQIKNCSYKIISLDGKVVISKIIGSITNNYSETIQISSLVKGQYELQITTDGKNVTRSLIKQ